MFTGAFGIHTALHRLPIVEVWSYRLLQLFRFGGGAPTYGPRPTKPIRFETLEKRSSSGLKWL